MGALVWAFTGHDTLGETLVIIGAVFAFLRLGVLVFAAALASYAISTAKRRGF